MSDDGLREKAISGAKWRVLTAYLSQAVQVAGAIILAWRLDDVDYGLVAGCMAVIALIQACGSLGMNYALVHRRDRIEDATSTGFVLLLIVAALSYAALLLVGPHTRPYGHEPTLLLALGLVFFLRPVAIVTEGTLQREFRFRRMFLIEFASVVVSTGLAIGLAVTLPAGHRYWALAISGLAREGMRSLVSWWCARIRPRLAFDWAVAKELLHYGKYFVGMAIVMALYGNLERLMVMELRSAAALGLYAFAYKWVFRVGDVTETPFGRVSVAVSARLQDDIPRLRSGFCRIVTYSALLSTGLLTGLILLAPDAVALIFPPRWKPTIPLFQVLGLFYMVRAVDTTTGQLYAAVGKPKLNLYMGLVNLGVIVATVVPLIMWLGPVGAAWSVLAARCAQLACNVFVCSRVLQCSLAALARIVRPALLASAVMAGVLAGAQWLATQLWGQVGGMALLGLILIGAATYVAALRILERELFRDIVGILRDGLKGMRARISEQATQ